MATSPTQARLEARISPETRDLLRRAAELQGRSLSDFVVSAAQDAALRVIAEREVVQLTLDDQARFAAALLEPAEPADALQRAFTRRRTLLDPAGNA
ncbi:type II toxin-antitoxin system TacA family antitoxin [Paraburkholderia sp. RL17-373-BIF-A]|uniref:type II toxin-antitoxin system TacA family antitoxin n=1 Tax=Paraburkholderia sp. RL17-373-BIF-A TaxID=3031629 RepID=UPI0038BDBAAD